MTNISRKYFDFVVKILDETMADYRVNPVDLLNIGDNEGEWTYLVNARRSYERTLRDVIAVIMSRQPEDGPVRILEIGAYLGVVSITLARLGFLVTALDIPEFMCNERLQERYRKGGVSTLSANLRDYRIPAESDCFDLVIMCETLEHLSFNPVPVLLEINRVMGVGGILYLSLPNLVSLVNRVKLLFGYSIHNPISDFFAQFRKDSNMIVGIHWREYTAKELVRLVRGSGFSPNRHYYFTPHRANFIARLLYVVIPSIRLNQTLIATKEGCPGWELTFYDSATT